jgi:hypothetical protein
MKQKSKIKKVTPETENINPVIETTVEDETNTKHEITKPLTQAELFNFIMNHYNDTYNENIKKIKEIKENNNEILKIILNLFLFQIKELKSRKELSNYSKFAIISIVKSTIENKLSSKFKNIINSICTYLNSNSILDLKNLSITNFIAGMRLIENESIGIKKFKSNDKLIETLNYYTDLKRIENARKLLGL